MIHYLLQIIGFQLLFLAVYEIFLKKETFFNWNRVYLLATPILSLILPFVQIPALQQSIPQAYKIVLPEFLLDNANQEVAIRGGVLPEVVVNGKASLDIFEIFLNVWYIGIAVSVLLFGFKLYKIWKLRQAGKVIQIDGLRVVTIPNSTVAFSFFYMMFLGENLSAKQRESIVLHEAIHIQERHSLDLLFFEIQRIIFWFNPLVYAFQNNMILLQEYTADARAVKQLDTKKYYQGLLSQVFQTETISFINTFFNHSFIKKRIIMLQKSKSKQLAKFKYVLLIPVVCSMLFYVACSEDNSSQISNIEQSDKETNLYVGYGKFEDSEILTVSVKDTTKLTKKEQLFVNLAKFEEGLKDIKRDNQCSSVGDVCKEMDEFFIVNYTERLHAVANSSGVFVNKLKTQLETTNHLYERKSKYIDFDDNPAIPFAAIEKVPTYPGCSGSTNEELKKCMSDQIAEQVNRNFNTSLGAELGLTGVNRIFVSFMINKSGEIVNIRSRAPHQDLETEVERVIKTLPKMQPGEQNGEPIGVLYSLPITFKISQYAQ